MKVKDGPGGTSSAREALLPLYCREKKRGVLNKNLKAKERHDPNPQAALTFSFVAAASGARSDGRPRKAK